mmetsp:Transcript_164721/g.528447  ORF Transcript_164721/g.528447 Transcript_164721/m.528447 type:complete len:918 (+) Transcript_164721:83-2836(+)|eukprot:CAMPEP_0203897654 /NCGR_PEP_ID=MMETSP0359-20131031/40254_1 /ASSEMBLY_ACC=CAM_ASM_000338 /TAXON_ID=268821 /ORGANISM="Scrippsiella Hangoei, Strain SHTV-5" /LENGTH=917 /DNA_ID=CAMNT_0050820587 /DNA_START=62 /DNA_END=2815 /DNA_ORIENTATION=+
MSRAPPPRRVRSLPSLLSPSAASNSSPLAEPLLLCTAHVKKRRVVIEAVGGNGAVRIVAQKRMPFVAFERGIEWERSNTMARLAPEPLPPLAEVIRAVERMQLEPLPPKEERVKKPVAFGGSGRARVGPVLPIQRPRLESVIQQFEPTASSSSEPTGASSASDRKKSSASHHANEQTRHLQLDAVEVNPSKLEDSRADARERSPLARIVAPTLVPEVPKLIEDVELRFPWAEEEMRLVFQKFDTDFDGEVHKDDMPAMILYLGARKSPQDAMRIVEVQTRYATLNYEEFVEFLGKYRDWDVAKLREEFKVADKDGGGFLDFEELYTLLTEMGYAPTLQSATEAMEAVDVDQNGQMDLVEFDGLREYLRKTEGMPKADVAELRMLYDKATNGSDATNREPAAEEVWRLTTFLGYSCGVQDIHDIAKAVDEDGSSALSFEELMKLIRLIREQEKDLMVKEFAAHGSNPDTLPIEDLGLALQDLGYFVSEDSVFEILETLGDLHSEDALNLEEFSTFMRRYRITEGFTEVEREELEDAFHKNKVNGRDALRTLDVGRVLRWFGFSKTVQEVQSLVRWIDFDCSGELELVEFFKLMRRMYQDESRLRYQIFDSFANRNTDEIPVSAVSSILTALQGCEPSMEFAVKALEFIAADIGQGKRRDSVEEAATSETVPTVVGQEGEASKEATKDAAKSVAFLNRPNFEAFCRYYRHLLVDEIHANAGYSKSEVANLRSSFQTYDKDGSGTVERAELAKMLGEYFPDSTKSKEGQKDIMLALAEVDKDGNGELDFSEFLLLMRKCDDARDAKDLRLELEVVMECELTPEEVEGFRQIFSENIDWKGELGLETLANLLGRVVEFTVETAEDLARMVREVHPEGREVARFPQFLRLIKKLTQDNYNHVNEFALRVVRREQAMKDKSSR